VQSTFLDRNEGEKKSERFLRVVDGDFGVAHILAGHVRRGRKERNSFGAGIYAGC
jgi:hypothetical protein